MGFLGRASPLFRTACLFAGLSLSSGCAAPELMAGFTEPQPVVVERDVVFQPGETGRLDVYRPSRAVGGLPVIVFFHGGFWQFGSNQELQNQVVAQELAKRGAVVMVPGYRLYPAATFPGFLEDGAAALAWARDHAATYGGDPDNLYVAGHSAGAYIAVMLAADGRYLAARGLDHRRLGGAIGIAGPYGEWFLDHPTVAPVFAGIPAAQALPEPFLGPDTPPLLLVSGSWDVFTRPGDTRHLAEVARARGGRAEAILYPMIGHLDIMMSLPWLPSFAPLSSDMARFIQARSEQRLAARQPPRQPPLRLTALPAP